MNEYCLHLSGYIYTFKARLCFVQTKPENIDKFNHLTWTSNICQRLKIPVKHMVSSNHSQMQNMLYQRIHKRRKQRQQQQKKHLEKEWNVFCKFFESQQKKNHKESDFSFGCWMFTMSHDVNDSWCVKIRWTVKKNGTWLGSIMQKTFAHEQHYEIDILVGLSSTDWSAWSQIKTFECNETSCMAIIFIHINRKRI